MSALAITCPICGDKILVPATMGAPHDGQVDTYIDTALFVAHVAAHNNGGRGDER
jgi:hypothetical protein